MDDLLRDVLSPSIQRRGAFSALTALIGAAGLSGIARAREPAPSLPAMSGPASAMSGGLPLDADLMLREPPPAPFN